MHNIHKFYGWLEVNTNTPIEVKLLVLYSGVFSALLYGVETWEDIELIKKEILSIEIKALKAILNVKKDTSNDLVYHELRRGTIFSKIKDQQWKFYQRLMKVKVDESLCISIYKICKEIEFAKYYRNLHGNNYKNDIEARNQKIITSEASMISYYRNLELHVKSCSIYKNYMIDINRKIISRWRLSNHTLRIETGRYENPPLPRNDRKCVICDVTEDEYHVVFICPTYSNLRHSFRELFQICDSVNMFLNPPVEQMNKIAKFLNGIEDIREKLKLK